MNPIGRTAKGHINELWPVEAVAMLKKLYAKGLTHGQIARKLPNAPTRNAVIGKAKRLIDLGLMQHRGGNEAAARHAIRASTLRTKPHEKSSFGRNLLRDTRAAAKPPNNHDDTPRPPKAPPPPKEAVPATARPWLTRLEGECRAPIGEPTADMLMCCARAGYGTNGDYCERHAARLFKTTPRQDDERVARRFA